MTDKTEQETGQEIPQEIEAEFEALQAEAGPAPSAGPGPGPEREPQKPPEIETAAMLEMMIGPMFQYITPAWNIQKQEVRMLSEAYAAVLDKWFPNGLDLGPEASAVMVTVMIFGPRMKQPRKLPKPEKPQGGDHESGRTE